MGSRLAYAVKCSIVSLALLSCATASTTPDASRQPDAEVLPDSAAPRPDAMPANCDEPLTGWQKLGTELNEVVAPGTHADTPTIAINGEGETIVAWVEGEPTSLRVRRWNGSAWEEAGGVISENAGNTPVYTPRAAARGGDLVIAYPEAGGAEGIGFYVRRWTGSNWTPLGGGDLSESNVDVSGGAVTFDVAGNVLVAWSQYTIGETGRNRIQVRRLGGDTYVRLDPELGGFAGPGASSITPTLTVDGDGTPVVALSESGARTFARNPSDTGWDPIGGGEVSATGSAIGAHSPQLARGLDGDPYILVAEYDENTSTSNGYLFEWDGGAWQPLGGALDRQPGVHSYVQDLVVDGQGRPVVVWTEGDDPQLLYVQRWNGAAFEDVGNMPLSAYGGTTTVASAQMTVDRCGRPVIAFSEGGVGDRAVHVFRYYE